MLTHNSQDFQKLPVFYLDPQTRAIAGSVNEKLLLLICTIFPVFSLASFALHWVFCFQNKLRKLALGITNLGHNPTSPNGWTQLDWGQSFRGLTWRRAWHVCRIRAVFVPPAPGKGSTSKPLTTAWRNPNRRQKSQTEPGRKAGLRKCHTTRRGHQLLCVATSTKLNSCFSRPS